MINVDTDFLSNLSKLTHEKEGWQKYLFIDVCPCTLRVALESFAPRWVLWTKQDTTTFYSIDISLKIDLSINDKFMWH